MAERTPSHCASPETIPAPITIKRAGKRNAGGLILLIPFKNHQRRITGPTSSPYYVVFY